MRISDWSSDVCSSDLNGTVTDENGKYFLELTNGNDAVLVFTYLGFLEKETPVNGRNIINMDMQPDQEQLDEVVVVGYGTQKKINLTGAVSQINSEMLEDRPVANISQALQGLVPNMNVNFGDGRPDRKSTRLNSSQ